LEAWSKRQFRHKTARGNNKQQITPLALDNFSTDQLSTEITFDAFFLKQMLLASLDPNYAFACGICTGRADLRPKSRERLSLLLAALH
jgi:hypothetical protein